MSYKVLVVDDEAPVRELFDELLKKNNCTVSSVASAEEALVLIKAEDFDVVLLDIKLTGINGLEALKRIKEIKPSLIVIMLTGFGYLEELIDMAIEYGAAGYIGKNLPVSEIIKNFKLFTQVAREKNERGRG